ncbi:hypothetical protein [Methylococcus mesophilus]|uniref:hypothetical protein n=1 Tax=Methylococcus mesophilus TaxID=2993564 RepID=UPI0037420142
MVDFPQAAPLRPELRENIRIVPIGLYLIFYTTHADQFRIERILSGSRSLSEDYFR